MRPCKEKSLLFNIYNDKNCNDAITKNVTSPASEELQYTNVVPDHVAHIVTYEETKCVKETNLFVIMITDKCVQHPNAAGKYMRYMGDGNGIVTVQYSDKECKKLEGTSKPTECDVCEESKDTGVIKAKKHKCFQYGQECSPKCAKGQYCKKGKCEKSDVPSGVNGLFLALAMVVLFLF